MSFPRHFFGFSSLFAEEMAKNTQNISAINSILYRIHPQSIAACS